MPPRNELSDVYERIRQLEERIESLEAKKVKTKNPTLEEVQEYFKENNCLNEAIDFFEFYESKGWMRGKNKILKWKLAASSWIRKNNGQSNNQGLRKNIQGIKPAAGKYDNVSIL